MLKYKELTKEHIKEIAEIYVGAFNSKPWNDQWTIESASKRISQMINCEGFDGLVVYEEEKIVGMILGNHEYYYNGMHFHIKEFCVDLKLKGKGIGSQLIEEFANRLKNKGIDKIILFTSKGDGTEGFYKKHEFESFEDMVMMGKEI
ncbi:putative acetyltransferase [Clostridium puniceum]|uniref:Putative acetyltransferase n=1 Tax=Clostridium puniceum TaxID=29367 RepID=A0A1S8T1C9_9CLOT|nr:GNAT family N-acetyltransferase [Clostridium puniceum]OOM71488.1 putative acetyltransferase [Clostridium puniceum]